MNDQILYCHLKQLKRETIYNVERMQREFLLLYRRLP